ncbi:Bax inhibitor-1 family protein, partial [Escherichia coli]|uniref:Bax inhibitor-1 family protein n=1 Tax=Escherichia coli TaxID=562 RepID=UPI001591A723
LGPILNTYLSACMCDEIAMALGGTSFVFFCCSAYLLPIPNYMSFLGGMLISGLVVFPFGMVANTFLHLPALHLAISPVFLPTYPGPTLFEPCHLSHSRS